MKHKGLRGADQLSDGVDPQTLGLRLRLSHGLVDSQPSDLDGITSLCFCFCCRWQILELYGFHFCVNQLPSLTFDQYLNRIAESLSISTSICRYVSYMFCFSREP